MARSRDQEDQKEQPEDYPDDPDTIAFKKFSHCLSSTSHSVSDKKYKRNDGY
ncbi:MAG: hypothetical protein JRF49_12960 [Deltaproteobacteria bacterium]|nr:hypothetical protein [Deltaproteobacteria bacterium]